MRPLPQIVFVAQLCSALAFPTERELDEVEVAKRDTSPTSLGSSLTIVTHNDLYGGWKFMIGWLA